MSTNLATRKSKNSKYLSNLINNLIYGVHTGDDHVLEEFFLSLDKAHQEMNDAENFFNNVVDPELIDHAIFKMEAAKSKYIYLLKQAREKGIRVQL